MRRVALAAFVLSVSFATLALDPIESAARDAAEKCHAIGATSIEECSNTAGRSPEHSLARRAVIRLYNARNSFVSACEASTALHQCQEQSDWLIGAGLAAANTDR